MLAAAVNQYRYRPAIHIVEAATGERKTCIRQVRHRGRKSNFELSHGFTVCRSEDAMSER